MQERLFIRLPATSATGPVPWFTLAAETQEVLASGQLNDLSELSQLVQPAQRSRVTIAVAGQDAVIEQVTLPAGARRHLNKVVPFALEEEVATDIDKLHFSWPVANRSLMPLPVVVCSKSCMQQWQAVIQQAGIEADEWIPDYLLLPYADNEWHCLQIGDQVIVRTGRWHGFTLEKSLLGQLPSLLAATTNNEDTSLARIVHYGELQWPQAPAPLSNADIEVPLTALALGEGGFDIRQQQFKPKRKRQAQSVNWRPLVIAAAACFAIAIVYNLLRVVSLNNQATALEQQTLALYQQQFPDERRVVNLRVQLQRKLDALGIGDAQRESVLALLEQLLGAFEKAPGMTLELLKYQQGELRLQALAGSFAEFERFQQQAEALGLSVQQGTLSNRGQQVAGTLTIASGEQS